MRERLLNAFGGLLRAGLVAVAFLLAIGSVGLSAVRGFCPEVDGAAAVTLAAAGDDRVALATIVETDDTDEEPPQDAPGGPEDDGVAPSDGATDPSTVPGDGSSDGDDADAGPCPGGVSRCLPPLISSVLLVGDPLCNEQAGGELRGRLVPAFVGSTVLLAGAWGLRPGSRVDRLLRG